MAAAALVAVTVPAAAHAQPAPPTDTPATGDVSSASSLEGLIPEEIVVGGPEIGAGSERLRDMGAGDSVDAALAVGGSVGSVAPLEAIGSTGGSAAASVASSGSLPGSTYTNPTGSIGSGVIGLGSVRVPEYFFGSLALQLAGGYVTAMGERQQDGELLPHELRFWHGVVQGSAEAGGTLEDAATATGAVLPGSLAGSIDSVQRAALEDPAAAQEARRADAAERLAAACADPEAAEAAGETVDPVECADLEEAGETADETAEDATAETAEETAPDAAASPPASRGTSAPGGAVAPASAPGGAAAPASAPPLAGVVGEATSRHALAATGGDSGPVAGAAALLLLVGGALVLAARRRV